MKSQDIRKSFISYFEKHSHKKIPSSSLIPHNDNTLLFANAGMNQFKDFFTGKDNPPFKRAVTIQKCVRAGGKHNDLENVGNTARHHTFFEMLGNFSFGDYFKKDAIHFAWEFLTKELKIPQDKLYVTVHTSDDEALDIWHNQEGVPKNRILKKGDASNFWEMGEVGPCGPCSEIYYDHGEQYSDKSFRPKSGEDFLDDGERYIEIWNLVFMQFEKSKDGIKKLPNPSIDTGAGLERLASVLQGKYFNYDTDIFAGIINSIESITGKKYCDKKYSASFRIVADHIRSSVMLITDGIIPSNEGRGYVLRRIIRRAIRHLKELNAPAISFYKLVPSVFDSLGSEYAQNMQNISLAEEILKNEEEKFLETLDIGLKFLDEAIKSDVKNNILSGNSAFKLYDTYGFPIDLTETILRDRGIAINQQEFDQAMAARKEDSKKSWKGQLNVDDKIFFQLKDLFGETKFVGYEKLSTSATILDTIKIKDNTALIVDTTPFYAESGGQIGDQGEIKLFDGTTLKISDVQKPIDNFWIHIVNGHPDIKKNSPCTLTVNHERRQLTMAHHTATHLLQAALIEILGGHVKQSGSMVSCDRLRFDFTHTKAVSKEELKKIEDRVNEKISASIPVTISLLKKDDAIAKGAMALFGEKYGEVVRIIDIPNCSMELCGGTHVKNTSDIKLFSILFETSLSSGIRRIEAVASDVAISRLKQRSIILENIEQLMNLKEDKCITRLEELYLDIKNKSKEIEDLRAKIEAKESESLFNDPEKIGNYFFKVVHAPSDLDLKKLSDNFISKFSNGILVLHTVRDNKTAVLLRTDKKSNIHAANILNETFKKYNGKGGGRPDMAQGTIDTNNAPSAIKDIEASIRSLI